MTNNHNSQPANDQGAPMMTNPREWLGKYWLILLPVLFSLVWIGLCLWWFMQSDKTLERMPLYEMGGLMAGASLPLITVWMIMPVFLRSRARWGHSPGNMKISAQIPIQEMENFTAAGDIAADRIEHLEKRLQEQIASLYEATTDAEAKAASLQTMLSSEREALCGLTDHITEQISQLQNHFEKINNISENMIKATSQHSENLNSEMASQNKSLEARFALMAGQMEKIADMTENQETALENFRDQSGLFNENAREITGEIRGEINKFSADMDNMRALSENTIHSIQEMTDQVGHHFSATDSQSAKLSESWLKMATLVNNQSEDSLSRLNDLGNRLQKLEKANGQAADLATKNFAKVTDLMQHASENIYLASSSAIEAADETNRAIDSNAEKFQQLINAIQLSNKSILSDANAIEKKNRDKGGSHFSALASKIIERLQSLSIDINRYFEEDVSDKIWQSYVEGDKNSFVRRLKKITSRKDTEAIRERYKTDPEFRKYSLEYLQIFEDMMAQSLASDTYSTFSVALISSEIGKIYLALAQAGDRISSK